MPNALTAENPQSSTQLQDRPSQSPTPTGQDSPTPEVPSIDPADVFSAETFEDYSPSVSSEAKPTENGDDSPTTQPEPETEDTGASLAAEASEGGDENGEAEEAKEPKQENPPQAKKRDYSKFPQEYQEFLKKVPNHVFNEFTKHYEKHSAMEAELKTLKEEKPGKFDSYADHEDAFQLLPEFKESFSKAQQAAAEADFWSQQLERIENGEKWTNLNAWDEGGNPLGSEAEPSAKAKVHVLNKIQQAHSLKATFIQEAGSVKKQFQENYKKAKEGLDGVQEKFFPWAKDEKHPLQEWVKKTVDNLPRVYKTHPLAILVGRATATNIALLEENKKLRAEQAQKVKQQEAKKHTLPKAKALAGAKKGPDDYNAKDFQD